MNSSPARLQILLPLPLDGPLDYLADASLCLKKGDFVTVPLGSRTHLGVVWDISPGRDEVAAEKLKPVLAKSDLPPLPPSLMEFITWLARYTLSRPGSVLRMAMTVPRKFGAPARKRLYRLSPVLPEKRALEKLTAGRQAVAAAAIGDMLLSLKDWAELAAVGEGVVRGMVKAGQMIAVDVTGDVPFPAPDPAIAGPELSAEQDKAAGHLRDMIRQGAFKPVLLEGITGSGKTEVYFEAIAEALNRQDGQILVLLPEISLTAQWLERFESRFGAPPVVWHSQLTPVQRRRAWWAAVKGQAKVVVGARSALFLPFQNLNLVVVDEEHSQTFKQEEGVIYQGRDMAVVRAMQADCPIILASATPSLETMLNAQSGKYDWLYLAERHGKAMLPEMSAVDLRAEKLKSGTWLSEPLRQALAETLGAGEQSLLYLNRRGYAPLTLCRACGHRMECPHCKAWLVEHKKRGRLICHHCGFGCAKPRICPQCEAEDSMVACGPGVERVAEEVQALFPEARIAVMASDEISGAAEMHEMIARIERHEVDIIIGTQIVTKGYHFPMLTLVGVVDADLGLSGGDPRAAERTWQQLEQVAGRAGRDVRPGSVIFQTYEPDHPVLKALISGDRHAFLEQEAHDRETKNLPPFGKLAAIIISGKDFNAVVKSARRISAMAPGDDNITVLGPVPAPMAYLRGKHRFRLLIKAEKSVNLQQVMGRWLARCPPERTVSLQVDIDPYSFF